MRLLPSFFKPRVADALALPFWVLGIYYFVCRLRDETPPRWMEWLLALFCGTALLVDGAFVLGLD